MLEHTSGTESFFPAMAPVLIANVLTVAFLYSFVKSSQKELRGEEEGRITYLWLIVLVFLFMLYGLYVWGVYPLKR
jgi:hypothetical protein